MMSLSETSERQIFSSYLCVLCVVQRVMVGWRWVPRVFFFWSCVCDTAACVVDDVGAVGSGVEVVWWYFLWV